MPENKAEYKIAAVVVTFNRLSLLQECIEALRNQTLLLDEIIVVNNSSTDGTLEWLNSQTYLTVVMQENSGSAGGQYTGIKTAYEKGFDWIWCMDDDAEPFVNALEELVKFFNQGTKVLACSVLDRNHVIQLNHRGYFHLNEIKKGDIQYPSEIEKYKPESSFEVDFASFVGIMLHKSIVKEVGLPKKEFYICHDDVEFCLRISKNCKTHVVTDSKIVHKEIISNKIEIKTFLSWKSERPLLSRYGIHCICYRNIFYLYKTYYRNQLIGMINVFYNYFVLARRIFLYDNKRLFRFRFLNKALLQAFTERFNNDNFLRL